MLGVVTKSDRRRLGFLFAARVDGQVISRSVSRRVDLPGNP